MGRLPCTESTVVIFKIAAFSSTYCFIIEIKGNKLKDKTKRGCLDTMLYIQIFLYFRTFRDALMKESLQRQIEGSIFLYQIDAL